MVGNRGVGGEFEEGMKELISEVQQGKKVILFIDEIEVVVGGG